jgi:uncharacterized YigZ family protein
MTNSVSKDTYLTIADVSEGLYKEKGSKFLAFAYPVATEDDVKEVLALLRKKYFDARHHCYAYMLGPEALQYRANDDGEPNHSAGDPILGQIRSRRLTDLLVVVVRYFGGIKLGVSGLIAAYKTAAAEALDAAVVIEMIVKDRIKIEFDYLSMNDVMRLIKDFELEIVSQQFDNSCTMTLIVRKNLTAHVTASLENISNLRLQTLAG